MKDPRDPLTRPEDGVHAKDKALCCDDASRSEIRLQDGAPTDFITRAAVQEIRFQGVTPIDFITRADSEESQPGAFAIPGIEETTLRRQERVLMRRVPSPEHPELLINAVVVDEEQPSLVFEASPLAIQKGNWKWITAILLLVLLLVCSVAIALLQASVHGTIKDDGTPSKALEGTTANNMTDIKSQPSIPITSSTPSNIPSPTPSKVPSATPSIYQAKWSKVGQDIAGEQHGDNIGKSLALSSSGQVMAVGLRSYDYGTEVDIGVVRIYELDSDGTWQQNGQDLAGSTAGEQAGSALDLSSDGSIVAVASCTGVVRVYEFNRAFNFWYPLGQELDIGGGVNASVGLSVSLSDDGLTLVAGVDLADEHGTDAIESVHIFQFSRDSAAWAPTAQAFYETNKGDRLGSAVRLSGNGEVVAMASVGHDTTTGMDVGLVQVYNRQEDLAWTTLGSPLSGKVSKDAFGKSISLSMNGMILAVTSRSSISIYRFDFEIQDWVKDEVDNPLMDEEVSFDNANETIVTVSLEAKMMAVSIANSTSLSGSVRVYALDANETKWLLVGEPIKTSVAAEWYTAPSVALSDNGVLAIGYPEIGSDSRGNLGRVQTYNFA